MTFSVVPAYGRKYETAADVIRDWQADKDFRCQTGRYINRSDWVKYNKQMDSVYYSPAGLLLEVGVLP